MTIIHASRVGLPTRQAVLELLGYPQDPIGPELRKIFDEGIKHEETALKQALHDIPYERAYEEEYCMAFKTKVNGREFIITASTDAQLADEFEDESEVYPAHTLVEVKNLSPNNFRQLRSARSLKKKFEKYYFQVQCYLWCHLKSQEGKLYLAKWKDKERSELEFVKKLDPLPYEKALFVIRNKRTREIHTFPVAFDEKTKKKIVSNCSEIVKYVEAKEIPDCDCTNKWCRYKESCEKVHIGSFKEPPKEKTTESFDLPIAYHFQVAGSTHHREAISNIHEMVEGGVAEKNLKVELIPEPDNKYDRNAIQVHVNDEFVGYVPKKYNQHAKDVLAKGFEPRVYRVGEYKGKPYITIFLWRN